MRAKRRSPFGGTSRERSRPTIRAGTGRDLSDRRHVHRVHCNVAHDHILSDFFIRPIPLPLDYLKSRGKRPTVLAEDIIRDGVEVT